MTDFHYAAFISYSSKDTAFARRLHRTLEAYRIPKELAGVRLSKSAKPGRIYPIFLDREEMAAGGLSERIEASLRDSGALIVVCSQHAAASKWVEDEIELFKRLGRTDRIFAIIPENAPIADRGGADITVRLFPAALKVAGALPVAADARPGRDGYRNAWLKIVAGLKGAYAGTLQDRERRRSRQRSVAAGIAAALAVLGAIGLLNFSTLTTQANNWVDYGRFAPSSETLANFEPGAIFQDCAAGSANCPEMVIVPAGGFVMGSDDRAQFLSHPPREIDVPRFAMSRTEITVRRWRACFEAGGCGAAMPPLTEERVGDDMPMTNVSRLDAQLYVAWLSRATGRHYRLPSEAEWEYAALGKSWIGEGRTVFSWGDQEPVCEDRAAPNGLTCRNYPAPVASFQPNGFGLYDMHGNVEEWVQDCLEPYDAAQTDARAVGGEGCLGDENITRGGGPYQTHFELRAAHRQSRKPTIRDLNIGFRVVRDL